MLIYMTYIELPINIRSICHLQVKTGNNKIYAMCINAKDTF